MSQSEFISPMIHSLSNLIKNKDYSALSTLYDAEEKQLMKELVAATDEKSLLILQGKAKMLKKLRNLPEESVDKYVNEKKRGTT